jgi:hypothetical protein
MNFHNFQSIIGSRKRGFDMKAATHSFAISPGREDSYIEPTFTKNQFDVEKPQVLLISAVGATGKSALAEVLSNRLKLPLLSLGQHKPVGDNTLTGLLTTSFPVDQLSAIFQSIDSGEYGIIIDGIDEGRSKTTEQAFQAFLDDIARLCKGATSPSFVLLGRTQILEECWIYLDDKGTSTGLLTIDPFSLDQARTYIDKFTDGTDSAQASQYNETRDLILNKLSTAFSTADAAPAGNFLSFIGYPPVLEAIVTLLDKERNYHRLRDQLADARSTNIEIDLLLKIAGYILARERDEKVLPNIVDPLLQSLVPPLEPSKKDLIFNPLEQCSRLVSHCIGLKASFSRIPDAVLNARYEEALAQFIVEHPFVNGRSFRNAIFEAVALSMLIASEEPENNNLALQYVDSHKDNYYLVYLLDLLATDGQLPLQCLRALLGAALEFKATNATVDLSILGPDAEESVGSTYVGVDIELTVGVSDERSKTFSFSCSIAATDSVDLGSRLSSAYVSLPGNAILRGSREVELTAPIEICAEVIEIPAQSLVLRPQASSSAEKYVILQAGKVRADVTSLTAAGVDFTIAVEDTSGLQYPLVQYMQKRATTPKDPAVREKYLRLRKILTHFRSHSKGAMAKYRDKIENERVAGNEIGGAVLKQLLRDGILTLKDPLYFIQTDQVDKFLGISWPDLRKGGMSEKLLQYLRSIPVS